MAIAYDMGDGDEFEDIREKALAVAEQLAASGAYDPDHYIRVVNPTHCLAVLAEGGSLSEGVDFHTYRGRMPLPPQDGEYLEHDD